MTKPSISLVLHEGSPTSYTRCTSPLRRRTYTLEIIMTTPMPIRRELPLYLGHTDPIGTVSADIIYCAGHEEDTLLVLRALARSYVDELSPGRGVYRRWFRDWWYPRTSRWRRLEEQVDDVLIWRLRTTDVRVVAQRRLSKREEMRARMEYLTQVLERARYRNWKMPE
jgi:hypothetical protein